MRTETALFSSRTLHTFDDMRTRVIAFAPHSLLWGCAAAHEQIIRAAQQSVVFVTAGCLPPVAGCPPLVSQPRILFGRG